VQEKLDATTTPNHYQWLHKKKERETTFTKGDIMNGIETT